MWQKPPAKAQVGMEYMLIFAFSLLIVAVLWTYSSSNIQNTKWDLQLAYARSSLDKIVEASDLMYVQGPPAQIYVYPVFPDNVNAVYISGKTVTLELYWKEGILRNLTVTTLANLTGNLSTAQGTHKLLVKAQANSVQVTEA